MAKFGWDHIHLRSPDPEATAKWYEQMLGAEVSRTMQQGKPRIDLKSKGVEFTREPTTVRPGTRVAFLRAPQGVSIELLDRDPSYK